MEAPAAAHRTRRPHGPRASVWVSASAGTGKTKVLTDRLLRLMLDGTDPARILCLTFTRAAAAEMANRLDGELANWATLPPGALLQTLAAADRANSRRGDDRPRAPAFRAAFSIRRAASRSRRSTPSARPCCAAFRSKPACRRNSP